MIAALEWAVGKREDAWSIDREMSALTAEILHSFMLGYYKSHGAKNVGDVLHIERPWEKNSKREQMISAGSFAAMLGGGRG